MNNFFKIQIDKKKKDQKSVAILNKCANKDEFMFGNSNSKPLKATTNDRSSEVEVHKVRISDEEFVSGYQVERKDLKRVNVTDLFKNLPTPEDIIQQSIGNCYFLAALANALRRDPNFISKILRITDDGNVAITFYDANDTTKKYIYTIDPTIVVKPPDSNLHTHVTIFLLEKAYAIHRLTLEPTKYSTIQKNIRDVLIQNSQLSSMKDEEILALLVDAMLQGVKVVMDKFDRYLAMDQEELSTHKDVDLDKLLSLLKKNNYQKDLTREELLAYAMNFVEENYRIEIPNVKYKLSKERKDYLSAITEGYPDVVLRSLTGLKTERVPIYYNDLNYYLEQFLYELRNELPKNCSPRVQDTLIKLFGSISDEKTQLFSEAIKNIPKDRWKVLQSYSMKLLHALELKQPIDVYSELLKIFTNFPNWPMGQEKVNENMMNAIQVYFANNTLQKRGTGKYVLNQIELYQCIKDGLRAGCCLVLSTRNSKIDTKKGIVYDHAYEVVNCYQQNGLCFVVLRNPWSRYVRDYARKDKVVNDKQLSVLSAVEREQIPKKTLKQMFLSKIGAAKEIEEQALPGQIDLYQHAYFAVELSDVSKNFDTLYTSSPLIASFTSKFTPDSGFDVKR